TYVSLFKLFLTQVYFSISFFFFSIYIKVIYIYIYIYVYICIYMSFFINIKMRCLLLCIKNTLVMTLNHHKLRSLVV
ncbi:MAG: hypothetical protein N7Q72_05405, partial [Spiroplasma sp. Tabriz.8]|nr:hypothetical protein [Spiroplasma sp. Tabriz.8]